MKNKLLLIFALIYLGLGTSYGQTLTIDSIIESRCAASGSVSLTVTPSAGGSDLWRVIACPPEYLTAAQLPGPYQNNGNFTSLPSGTYTFQYSDGVTTVDTAGVVVPGTYMDPVFIIDSTKDAICPGQGAIYVTMSDGNDPYRYRLYNPDSALGNYTAWQSTGTFTGLRANTYEVQAEDSCGVIKTISGIFIDHPSGGPIWYDYKGNTQVYYTDDAINIPQNCTQSTVGVYLIRNYAMRNNSSVYRDGNGNVISDLHSTTEKPLELVGGQPPYSYTLTESEAYYLLPEPTDTFNDYRPRPPFSGATSSQGSDDGKGMIFDVANDLTLYSVGFIGSRSGANFRIALYDNAGNLMYQKFEEQNINAGNDNLASLGWFIPAGTGYRLVKYGGYAENHAFTTNPYPISAGDITVTGPHSGGTSTYLFYWTSVVYTKKYLGDSRTYRFGFVFKCS